MSERAIHPYAKLFPELDALESLKLYASIRDEGLRAPILVDPAGAILDGRARYRVCQALGIAIRETTIRTMEPTEVLKILVERNVKARNLTRVQRACVSARLHRLFVSSKREVRGVTKFLKQFESLLGVSNRTTLYARNIHDAAPRLFARLERDHLTIEEAHALMREGRGYRSTIKRRNAQQTKSAKSPLRETKRWSRQCVERIRGVLNEGTNHQVIIRRAWENRRRLDIMQVRDIASALRRVAQSFEREAKRFEAFNDERRNLT